MAIRSGRPLLLPQALVVLLLGGEAVARCSTASQLTTGQHCSRNVLRIVAGSNGGLQRGSPRATPHRRWPLTPHATKGEEAAPTGNPGHKPQSSILNTDAEDETGEVKYSKTNDVVVVENLRSVVKQIQDLKALLNPEILAIMSVYFVQGILGLSSLATTFFLKDEMHLSPAEMAALTGITSLPWVIKPLYGFISDTVPLFGYRRRSYLFLAGILGSASWLVLGLAAQTPSQAIAARTVASLAIAVSDVVVDSVVVERSRDSQEEAGTLQSLCWGARYFGAAITAYYSGELLERMAPRSVFLITALFPLLVTLFSGYFKEETGRALPTKASASVSSVDAPHSSVSLPSFPGKKETFIGNNDVGDSNVDAIVDQIPSTSTAMVDDSSVPPSLSPLQTPLPVSSSTSSLSARLVSQVREVWEAAKQPSVLYPMLFVLAWQATPNASSGFFYFLTNELQMKPEFLGRLQVAGSISSLLGVYLYQTRLKAMPIKDLLRACTLLSVPLGLTQLILINGANRLVGIPDTWFALGDDIMLSALGEIAFMPLLVISAKVCPVGVEGTLFATLMSLFNLSGIISSEIGSALTAYFGVTESNFSNLGLVVAICNFSSLIPLLLINNLDRISFESDDIDSSGNGPGDSSLQEPAATTKN